VLFDVESVIDESSDFLPIEFSVMSHLQLKGNQGAGTKLSVNSSVCILKCTLLFCDDSLPHTKGFWPQQCFSRPEIYPMYILKMKKISAMED